MIRRDTISGLFWLAVGLFMVVSSVKLGIGEFREPGSGFVPFYAGLLFFGATALMMIRGRLGEAVAERLADGWCGLHWHLVVVIVAGSVIYLLLLERLGYLIATIGFMLLLFGLGRMRLWVGLAWAITTVLGSYVIFHLLLKVPLPRGMLGF